MKRKWSIKHYTVNFVLISVLCSVVWAETDITASSNVNRSRPIYDYVNQQTYTDLTLQNISNQLFYAPLKLVIDSIIPESVTVAGPDGVTSSGKPYFDYSNLISGGVFNPNEISAARTIRFDNPDRLRFRFTSMVLAETEPSGDCDSWGDPHLITCDRLAYDFQGAGEFILTRSTDNDFEVQGRMVPWGGSRTVSIISAVAINVAGDRVGVYLNRNPELYINGTPTILNSQTTPLPNGGQVVLSQGGYTILWPDGSHVRVSSRSSYINLKVLLAGSRRAKVEGLLGNFDGTRENELVTSDGDAISVPPSFSELYEQYGESWRITQENSLFDYLDGNNTETYTDRTFPGGFVTTVVLPPNVYQQAEQQCLDAGVTDPILLEACILDVGLTGDSSFAELPAGITPPEDAIVIDGSLGRAENHPAKSCLDIQQYGVPDGDKNYWISLPGGVFEMHCNFSADTGGWTRVAALDTTQGFCGNNSLIDLRIDPNASMGKVPDSDVQSLIAATADSPMELMYFSRSDNRYIWHTLESIADYNTGGKHTSSSFYCSNWHCDDGTIDHSSCGAEGQGCPVTAHGIGGFTKKIYVDSNFSRHIRGMHMNGNMCGLPNYERTSIWIYVR